MLSVTACIALMYDPGGYNMGSEFCIGINRGKNFENLLKTARMQFMKYVIRFGITQMSFGSLVIFI